MTATITDRPAILGGMPRVTADHEAANRWPILDEKDEQAVLRVMRDGKISGHPVIRKLEANYARLTGMPQALAHNNGTAGLLAAFHAIGLGPGDEVLVPTATFWASVLPMMWLGAVPVFCESEPERLGLDPVDMEAKITPRTRAIVVVHMFGLPSKMTEIRALAAKHDLRIIEDASHAHGATWRGQPCGSLGDIAVFSMQGDKLVPAGEGGMFLCRDDEHYERAACLGDISRIIELETPARQFAATGLGIKTRISPLSAAIGCSQLARLEERNSRRNANVEYLSHMLEELGFHCFLPPGHIRRVYFEFIIRHDPARIPLSTPLLVKALQAEGCHVGQPRYPMLHQQPFFTEGRFHEIARLPEGMAPPKYRADELPRTLTGNETLIKLPTFPNADWEILDQYADAYAKVCENAEAILAGHKEDAA
jgi:dTDP-4-amino-4,6-dideoxygalactose transaminase